MKLKNDFTGKKIKMLTILQRDESKKFKRPQWIAQCDCGNIISISGKYLYSNSTITSCGCRRKKRFYTHGFSNTKIYKIYKGIKARCYNPKNNAYKYYGGKGIKLCSEWLNDFISFYNWSIENGYASNLTIDRIDNNKDYEPSNCRWVTIEEQSKNRTNVRKIEFKKEIYSLTDLSKIININRITLRKCIEKEIPIEYILKIKENCKTKKVDDYYQEYLKLKKEEI